MKGSKVRSFPKGVKVRRLRPESIEGPGFNSGVMSLIHEGRDMGIRLGLTRAHKLFPPKNK